MLDWIVELVIAIVSYVPAQFVPPNSPRFVLIRSMFGLLLIVLVLSILALRPLRSLRRYMRNRQSTDHRMDH